MAWYRTGTISVTNGSAAVTGSGTSWLLNVSAGEAMLLPDGKLYEIQSINSNTSITLATTYTGSTQSGQTYVVVPTQSYIRDLAAQAATLVNTYSTLANNAGAGKFSDGTAAAPGITFVADQDTGFFRSANNEVTFVANGVAQFKYSATGGITFLNNTVTINGTALVKTDDARLTNSREWTASTVDQAEAEAGAGTTRRAWTAQRVRQAIAAWWNTITNIDGKNIGATTAGTGRFTTLTTTGDVAIGRPSAASRLHVLGAAPTLIVQDSATSLAVTDAALRLTGSTADGSPRTDIQWRIANKAQNLVFEYGPTPSEVASINSTGLSVTGNLTTTGNTTLGDSSSDTVTVNGVVGVGTSPVSGNLVRVVGSGLFGVGPNIGVSSLPTGSPLNTTVLEAYASVPASAASAYTVTTVSGYHAYNATKGAGSTITNQHGVLIDDQTQGTNNYGITSQVSAGPNKRNLNITGTADNYFAGNVGVGVASSAWIPSIRAIDVSPASAFWGYLFGGTAPRTLVSNNAYLNSAGNYIYKVDGIASEYRQIQGQHVLLAAPQGAAGSAITFTTVFAVERDKSIALQGATSQNGIGISFPATQNASADANTLDDYEEGTFTPALSFTTPGDLSVTYSTQLGRYTKVGRLVTATLTVITSAFTHTTASGALRISGMPFVAATDSANLASGVCGVQGYVDTTRTNLYAVMDSGTAICALRSWEQGQTLSVPQASSFPSGTQKAITITISYTV